MIVPPVDKTISLSDDFEAFEPAQIEAAPDGGIQPLPVLELPPIPKADQATMVCLRGPCEHLMTVVALPDMITVAGYTPAEKHHYCRRIVGHVLDLGDTGVAACTEWSPISPALLARRQRARAAWLRAQAPKPLWRRLFDFLTRGQKEIEAEAARVEAAFSAPKNPDPPPAKAQTAAGEILADADLPPLEPPPLPPPPDDLPEDP